MHRFGESYYSSLGSLVRNQSCDLTLSRGNDRLAQCCTRSERTRPVRFPRRVSDNSGAKTHADLTALRTSRSPTTPVAFTLKKRESCSYNWRKIAIALTEQSMSANAWFQQLRLLTPQRTGVPGPTAVVQAAIATFRIPPWLPLGWGCRGRRRLHVVRESS